MLTHLRTFAVVLTLSCALLAPGSASASNSMLLGLFDDAVTLDSNTDAFPLLQSLHVQVVRMTLTWGGPGGVANKLPAHPSDPSDPAYDWGRYDQAVQRANDAGVQLLMTIVGTPAWRTAGSRRRRRRPPRRRCARSPTPRRCVTAAPSSTRGRERSCPASVSGSRGTSRTTPSSCSPS